MQMVLKYHAVFYVFELANFLSVRVCIDFSPINGQSTGIKRKKYSTFGLIARFNLWFAEKSRIWYQSLAQGYRDRGGAPSARILGLPTALYLNIEMKKLVSLTSCNVMQCEPCFKDENKTRILRL